MNLVFGRLFSTSWKVSTTKYVIYIVQNAEGTVVEIPFLNKDIYLVCTFFGIINCQFEEMSIFKIQEDRILGTFSVTLKNQNGRYIH